MLIWLIWSSVLLFATGCRGKVTTSDDHSTLPPPVDEQSVEPAWQPRGRLVDLTHAFDESTVYWPTGEGFQLRQDAAGVTDKGYYYSANTFTAAEHGGTHIDAPIHFFQGRRTVDQISLEQLIAPAVLVDVREQCDANRDYQISVADLRAWEEKHGRQLVDVVVLLRTGYAKHWPDREQYLGTSAQGEEAVKDLHFPGLSPEAAKWLVEQRAPLLVGIDTASIDYGQSTHFQTHVTLFEHNVPALENVNITDVIPAVDFTLIALPIKIAGGSGGPTRVVAVVP